MNDTEDMFRPIGNRSRTFEEVFNQIKELVFSGALKHGDRLPSETQLALKFNVGRQTIREALRLLERSGFISIKKGAGGGPIIKDTIIEKISDLYLDAIRMRRISLEELTKARLGIEGAILSEVIDNIEEIDVKSIRKNIARARRKLKNGMVATEENCEFHNLLARASKNHVYVVVTESIMAISADTYTQSGADLEDSKNMLGYHEKILDAILEKDKQKAIRLSEESLMTASILIKSKDKLMSSTPTA